MYGPNNKCVNTKYKSCDDRARDETCAGVNLANYVYEIVQGTYYKLARLSVL